MDDSLQGIFKSRYALIGKDWVRRLPNEDRQVFIHMGLAAMEYGHLGGLARAATAKRDRRGRFAKA